MQRTHVILATAALIMIGVAAWLYHEVNIGPAEAAAEHTADKVASVTPPPPSPSPPPPPTDDAGPQKTLPDPNRHAASPWSAQLKSGMAAQFTKPNGSAENAVGPPDPATPDKADPKWDAILAEVNKSYDRGDYDDAKTDAIKVLAKDPTNVRMLRVVVSSSCMTGDALDAQAYFEKLTDKRDRDQMRVRCDRYQVTLTDPK